MEQRLASAATSINIVPAVFKSKAFLQSGTDRNLDIGGGRFDTATQWLLDQYGIHNFIYDPFNRDDDHNAAVLEAFQHHPAPTVTVSNVLNVIAEEDVRHSVIAMAYGCLLPGGSAFFTIYEGDGFGVGKATPKGWQCHRRWRSFLPEISAVFPLVKIMERIVIAIRPPPAA